MEGFITQERFGNLFKKVVLRVMLPVLLPGVSGCRKEPEKTPQHELSEIITLSMICSHMDYSYSYAFMLTREGDEWLLDAECCTQDDQEKTVISGRAISSEDVEVMYDLLENHDMIAYVESYEEPEESPFEILDETTYSFCLSFSDGSSYVTNSFGDAREELEDFFYRLAEAFAEDAQDREKEDLSLHWTEVSGGLLDTCTQMLGKAVLISRKYLTESDMENKPHRNPPNGGCAIAGNQ